MVVYLLQITILWCVFSAIYYFVLSNKSMFWFNRWYLLVTFAGSLTIPLLPFNETFGGVFSVNTVLLPQTILLNELVIDQNTSTIFQFDWISVLKIFFAIGTAFFLFRFFRELIKINQLRRQSEKIIYDDLLVCKIPHKQQVFSFWKTIFIDQNLFETINKKDSIWIHEKTHIQQWHSADVLLIEICKVFLWFHPMIYLYERHIKMNHEYLADQAVLKQTNDVKSYQYQLLDYLENTNNPLASTFNFKLTQKRFIMMKSKTSPTVKMITKVFVAFGIIATITFVACTEKQESQTEKQDVRRDMPYVELAVDEAESGYNVDTNEPLKFVEQKAQPSKGMQMFFSEFLRKFNTPKEVVSNEQKEIKLKLNFVVEKDGSLSDIYETTGADKLLAEEGIRVLKSMSYWIPAQHEGKVVRSTFTLPIKIRVNH